MPVSELHVGMHVRKADSTYGEITGWYVVPGASVMYNLTVAQDHTYTVGDEHWVVHNNGPECDQSLFSILSDAGNAPTAKDGLTKADQAFQKHASREEGSKLWGSVKGGPSVLSERGQMLLDQFINDPETKWAVNAGSRIIGRYGGDLLEAVSSDGRGARWMADDFSQFVGFMNP